MTWLFIDGQWSLSRDKNVMRHYSGSVGLEPSPESLQQGGFTFMQGGLTMRKVNKIYKLR